MKATGQTDQEHIKLVVEQNPQTPTAPPAFWGRGDDPTFALYGMAMKLEADGLRRRHRALQHGARLHAPSLSGICRFPASTCRRRPLEEIQAKLGKDARIGLLATRGTVQSRIYAEKARRWGCRCSCPTEERQDRVMAAIYSNT